MDTASDLLKFRNNASVLSVSPFDTVASAFYKMADAGASAIVVMEMGELVGIFSEHDYSRKLLSEGKPLLATPIHQLMVRNVLYVTPDYLLNECLALMTKKHIHHLPVIDEGKVLALLSLEDVVEALLDGKEFIINELTRYVTGSLTIEFDLQKKSDVRELVFVKSRRYDQSSLRQ